MPIQRMTCFKLKNEEDIPAMLEQYKTIEKSNTKVRLLHLPPANSPYMTCH